MDAAWVLEGVDRFWQMVPPAALASRHEKGLPVGSPGRSRPAVPARAHHLL
jgi:hypothetical protein